MFEVIVACLVGWAILSVPAAIVVGRMFVRNDASWHSVPLGSPDAMGFVVDPELVAINDAIDHEQRLVLVSYLRTCIINDVDDGVRTFTVNVNGEVTF